MTSEIEERIGVESGDQGFPDWVRCPRPECGSDKVCVYTDYDRAIGFICRECGYSQEPSYGEFISNE